jgi:hypothetical protein
MREQKRRDEEEPIRAPFYLRSVDFFDEKESKYLSDFNGTY